jgi:hypothetical protein
MTQEQLEERTRYWQKVLRLQDWDVRVAIKRRHEFHVEERSGEIILDRYERSANVRLLDPQDYPPDCIRSQDMERTLVHELLHLHTDFFKEEDHSVAEEQAINAIAMALIALERKDAGPDPT